MIACTYRLDSDASASATMCINISHVIDIVPARGPRESCESGSDHGVSALGSKAQES
jgi:hypothetical protein